MAEHTPGPWQIVEHFQKRGTLCVTGPEAVGGAHVDVCYLPPSTDQAADARFIATAPALEEALEECKEVFEEVADFFDHGDTTDGLLCAHNLARLADGREAARAALALARGEAEDV